MNIRLSSAAQLSAHLRSLRKAKGLTQAQLGLLIEVGQARIADIEKHPGTVNVDQMLRILHALGAQVLLQPPPGNEPPKREGLWAEEGRPADDAW